ncbi:Histone transcription regulator 3, partial [Ascosphaera pollenicola]
DELEDEAGETLGLERASAVHELQKILSSCEDDVSFALNQFKQPRKVLRRLIEQKADPFPYLKQPTASRLADLALDRPINHTLLAPESCTWAALGDAILHALRENSKGSGIDVAGSVKIELPDPIDISTADSFHSLPDSHEKSPSSKQNPSNSDSITTSESAKENPICRAAPDNGVIQSTENSTDDSKEDGVQVDAEEQTPNNAYNEGIAIAMQTRKRSSTFDEQGESGRTKSKRLRARESHVDSANAEAIQLSHAKYLEDLLEPYIKADEALFNAANDILSKLGWSTLGSPRETRTYWGNYLQSNSRNSKPPSDEALEVTMASNLRSLMDQWDETNTKLSSENIDFCGTIKHSPNRSLRAANAEENEIKRMALNILSGSLPQGFQEHMDVDTPDTKGLLHFSDRVNNDQLDISSVALLWLKAHLGSQTSSYLTNRWSSDMKKVMAAMITEFDSDIFAMLQKFVVKLDNSLGTVDDASDLLEELNSFVMLTQALFELHLETLSATTKCDPVVAPTRLAMEQNCVSRWGSLAYLLIQHQINLGARDDIECIKIRHLWASILRINMTREEESEYILASLRELKEMLVSLGNPVINLANNSIICEISVDAVEQEVSRLRSLDFFASLLKPGYDDPVKSIEHIAPLLEPESVEFVGDTSESRQIASRFKEVATFLDTRSPTLRIYLWDRLQNAYDDLNHLPKVIDCCVHKIQVIVDGLYDSKTVHLPASKQGEILLKSLNSLCVLLRELRIKVLEESEHTFDCLDTPRLRTALESFIKPLRLLYTVVIAEDAFKIGIVNTPDIRPASNARNLELFKDKLRSIVNDCWTLQYLFLKEAMAQNHESFESPESLRSAYLRACHGFLGIRFLCKYADKAYLQLMAKELQTLPPEDDYEYEMAQLYFDLYGLKFGAGLDAIVDHHCPFGPMDVRTAVSIVDFIMMQAKRINNKDLPKSELKAAIDTVYMSIGRPARGYPSLNLNRRLLKNFLQSPIDPRQLFKCLDGIGDLSIVTVNIYSTKLARNGWYTLLGQSALTKFRSQKRLAPASTEELDAAIASFKQEIEHGYGDWKTWYSLAQAYDLQLEEEISWVADKINKNDEQIVEFQRGAIHAYTMAVASITRALEISPQDLKLSSELYADFGNRLYASSREPLSMKAFSLAHIERPFSSSSFTMYRSSPFAELKIYSAWELASYLFQKAMDANPGRWK